MSDAVLEFEIRRDDALGPDALALIEGSEVEQAAIYPPEVRSAFSPEELTSAGTVFCVAYLRGTPVACGGFAPYPGFGELKRIFALIEARGTGAARAVILWLENEARAQGLTLMKLETGKDSPAALRLYEKLGYRRTGPFGSYFENGSSIFMEKDL